VAERYVRPPLVAREATPVWVGVWRFRVAALVLLAVLVLIAVQVFQSVTGANSQDPGIDALTGRLAVLSLARG